MTFDFWAMANDPAFQQQAVDESAAGSFKDFTEPGEYDVTLSHGEYRESQAGYQTISMRVRADSGESGFWTLLVGHGGGQSQAARIAHQTLASIVRQSGRRVNSPEGLNGIRLRVWVGFRDGTDGKRYPNFRVIGPAGGAQAAAPGHQSAPKPVQPAYQAQPPAQPPASQTVSEDDDIPF